MGTEKDGAGSPILPPDFSLAGLVMVGAGIGAVLGAMVDRFLHVPRDEADRSNKWMLIGAGFGVIIYFAHLKFGVQF